MSSENQTKSITVMLDAEITESLKKLHTSLVQRIADAEMEGVVSPPTMGHLARTLLRGRLGLPEADKDDLYRP